MTARSRLLLLVGALLLLVVAGHGRGSSDLGTAYDTLRKVSLQIHVGMKGAEVERLADAAGLRSVKFSVANDPEVKATATDTYSISIGVPIQEAPGIISMTIRVRDGVVDWVSPIMPPEP
ncbi:hypothetical protein UCD39_19725 [Nitrospirillum sp. BR 11752]|uniref:hypothetical protein n=1 Tax=Nitrospirillum sp. BR 11752 TaxID=3104293 RepID=UPI002EABEFEA|nr:hypothetical protein [Nitrospirillum sp. BR 11752]